MKPLAVAAFLTLATLACVSDPLPGYLRASSEQRAALVAVVREYYDLFDRAEVSGDVTPLYARHPQLASGEDRRAGINTEAWLVERVRALSVRDVSIDLEWYEPMKAFVKGNAAVVYVHGLFTWVYPNGSETKGELPVRFDLARAADSWNIVRTDELVLGETPAPTPR